MIHIFYPHISGVRHAAFQMPHFMCHRNQNCIGKFSDLTNLIKVDHSLSEDGFGGAADDHPSATLPTARKTDKPKAEEEAEEAQVIHQTDEPLTAEQRAELTATIDMRIPKAGTVDNA